MARTTSSCPFTDAGPGLSIRTTSCTADRSGCVSGAATLLTRHLAFFFIPITVGLMGLTDVFVANGAAIVITLVVSAVLGICVAGFTSQALAARKQRRAA